eukprot:TRINITY_DN11931_c0_g1_i2.p1 TRINITY_DN11931_c0_g1~~TRINITY_DN11931_c0_g1_i2.p1  ORF type:complete len:114 (-),score=8.17 TRINITY_DN11931_c0_g1_i2:80-421(-)
MEYINESVCNESLIKANDSCAKNLKTYIPKYSVSATTTPARSSKHSFVQSKRSNKSPNKLPRRVNSPMIGKLENVISAVRMGSKTKRLKIGKHKVYKKKIQKHRVMSPYKLYS